MADAHKNAAYSLVATAPSPASSGTSLVVTAGEGVRFPTPPFNATVWATGVQPSFAPGLGTGGNFEIVRVTGVATDTFTITRAQETTSARAIVVGDQIAATITAKTLTDIETTGIGYEIGYDEITASVTVASTTESAGTTVISCGAHTFDGAPVLVEFYSALVRSGTTAGSQVIVCLFEASTEITRLGFIQTPAAAAGGGAMHTAYRFTPTAGSHTYTVTAFTSNATGSPIVAAASAGTGAGSPAFIRFTKV